MKKNVLALVLAVCCVLGLSVQAFAADVGEQLPSEIEEFYREVEEHNRLVEEKWQQALAQSEREKEAYEELLASLPPVQPTAVLNPSLSDQELVALLHWALFYQTASFNTTTASGGYPIITSVSRTGATRRTSSDSVADYYAQRTIIDTGRTLAVNCSMTVGRQAGDGKWYYKPISRYIEFYADGGGIIW